MTMSCCSAHGAIYPPPIQFVAAPPINVSRSARQRHSTTVMSRPATPRKAATSDEEVVSRKEAAECPGLIVATLYVLMSG